MLLDPLSDDRYKVGESLPGAARPLLRDLGLLELVDEGIHLPSYGNLSAWGSEELRVTDSLRDPHGPGWHLDRARFDAALRRAAFDAGAVFRPTRVRSIRRTGSSWQLGCRGVTLEARWVVDATGRHATLARGLGVDRRRDDRLCALCAWVTGDFGEDGRTLVEAAPDGWWYTVGLPNADRVVVLHVDGDAVAAILHTEGAWTERLGRTVHIRAALSDTELQIGPLATEACGGRLERFAGDGWLAVGDAALSFDPLSSQGIFDALYSGLRGGEAVHAALDGRTDRVEAYIERMESIRREYLRHHRIYYGEERRWPDRPFWARRTARNK